MDSVRQYLLTVTAAALVCAILDTLTGRLGKMSGVIKTVSGLFFIYILLSPVISVDMEHIFSLPESFLSASMQPVEQGKEAGTEAMQQIIKERTESYILEEASRLGVQLEVSVHVSSESTPVPESVLIRGNISPYAKYSLAEYIAQELGIPKESQQWNA